MDPTLKSNPMFLASMNVLKSRMTLMASKLEFEEKENDPKVTIKYHTREAFIQPLNEHTLKKKQLKEEQLEQLMKQKKLEKRAELEHKMRLLELNEKQRLKEEEEELRAYRREQRQIEEMEELEKLVG